MASCEMQSGRLQRQLCRLLQFTIAEFIWHNDGSCFMRKKHNLVGLLTLLVLLQVLVAANENTFIDFLSTSRVLDYTARRFIPSQKPLRPKGQSQVMSCLCFYVPLSIFSPLHYTSSHLTPQFECSVPYMLPSPPQYLRPPASKVPSSTSTELSMCNLNISVCPHGRQFRWCRLAQNRLALRT